MGAKGCDKLALTRRVLNVPTGPGPFPAVVLAHGFNGSDSNGWSFYKVEDALERDYFLTAEAAKDFGLVDKVIDKRPEEMPSKPA